MLCPAKRWKEAHLVSCWVYNLKIKNIPDPHGNTQNQLRKTVRLVNLTRTRLNYLLKNLSLYLHIPKSKGRIAISGSTEKQIYKYTYIVHSGTDQRWATLAQRHTAKAARQETSFLWGWRLASSLLGWFPNTSITCIPCCEFLISNGPLLLFLLQLQPATPGLMLCSKDLHANQLITKTKPHILLAEPFLILPPIQP